ncbi:Hypothetical protein P9211_08031 [Prochlorococcus marinus str. MIT 9211]|uniref:Uncharacterized protein n=2 Tax=Prochlorococcus marinus TaxID=1219 RepID=A9BA72_PROM4|nr:Hypothetical protein P9211_08031 [Prochlorococcus marinus str. MIT 9211]
MIMETTSSLVYETIYVADVMACTTVNGCLSQRDANALLSEHGADYEEFAEECGKILDAKSILHWLGY